MSSRPPGGWLIRFRPPPKNRQKAVQFKGSTTIGNLENNDTSSDCITTRAWELTNSNSGQGYDYAFYAEPVVKDLYSLDASGSILGTCLDSKEKKRLFVVFDIDPTVELTLTFRKQDGGQPVKLHSALSIVNAPTQTPTNIQEPTSTSSFADTQEVPELGLLPGLQPIDVELNLENRQFNCELVYVPEENYPDFKWECISETAQYYMLVEIWSKSLVTVDLLQSTILQFGTPDAELAANFLGFMATMPYDGAEPEKARTWVEDTLPTIIVSGDVREATFSGVKFQLYGIPTARFLEIGKDLPSP